LYSYVPGAVTIGTYDAQSDNYESSPINLIASGQIIVPPTAPGPTSTSGTSWSWGPLYQVNYFLENYQKATGSASVIDNYVGVARFFRAWFYFDKVKTYGDVPWYGRTITTADNANLLKPRDSRVLVIDSVMADLRYAAKYVNPAGTATGTVTKWTALALMARVGLHEGTFRKYHNIAGWQPLLQTADSAALAIMQSGTFKLYTTGKPSTDYQNLFLTYTPADPQNSEIMLASYYSSALHHLNALDGAIRASGYALNKAFMNNYLTSNGTPFTSVPGYATMMIQDEFQNRDPRLAQSVLAPTVLNYGSPGGFILNGPNVMSIALTGYQQIKYYDPTANGGYGYNANAGINFRYGETLLIYAEAKTELANAGTGTFTQTDLDMSVNLLRDRVGMPHLLMNVPLDPVLATAYPNVSGSLQNVLLEIRRERRVELACEGFRYDDLMRWKAGPLMALPGVGMYFPGLGIYNMGTTTPQIGLVTTLPANPIAGVSYFVVGAGGLTLSNGTSGNLVPNPGAVKTFTDPRNYLMPIPAAELLLNKNLKQNPGY